MNIALFGKKLNDENIPYFLILLQKLKEYNTGILIYDCFYDRIKDKVHIDPAVKTFKTHLDLIGKADFLFSFGGDGTLLDTITLVRDSGIPVM